MYRIVRAIALTISSYVPEIAKSFSAQQSLFESNSAFVYTIDFIYKFDHYRLN